MTDTALRDAEAIVFDLTRRLTGVRDEECLYCYVARMLKEHGCDNTLRWAARYRDLRAPRATALERRLGQMGGFCDCEIFLNGVALAGRGDETEWGEDADGAQPRQPGDQAGTRALPECRGARAGSTRGCTLWGRRRRGW